ncbi:baseplate J/gp47 family protein [Desulfosporosinus nitroreducens]|uniref:baseplate J/gp47 family protein n=1 Tax=Desulfosporosinus nitroreducens TaxID=2018668 RepID=UPI00207CB5A3|nr:baseplate J/gp47 family protein [Desulfosporosinus nitroreducens]MCO1599818.1 baseplate J/gp47 family protein [Desulfosporosinus nitroreducens]
MSSEEISTRMLGNIPTEVDKSEGSFFYDAIKSVAIELETKQEEISIALGRGFATTAEGEYLDRKVSEQNITRKPATNATGNVTITGQHGAIIKTGMKVSSASLTYTYDSEDKVIGVTTIETVMVKCDTLGSIGNVPSDTIKFFPVSVAGLSAVTNNDAFTNGYDGEPDNELRERYLEKIRTPPTSGNKYHYSNWAKEVTGIGDAKVFPLWAGAGTVKVVIIDSNKQPPGSELVVDVANNIEDHRPIGATVTVEAAAGKDIDISVSLTISSEYTQNQVEINIQTNIIAYLAEIAFVETYVSFARIGSLILGSEGVLDYTGLTVNTGTANIAIADTEVAILGIITLT